MKYLSHTLIVFALIFTACSRSDNSEVDKIWNTYLQSFGDSVKIDNLKTLYYETITTTEEGVYKGTITQKYPDKSRQTFMYQNGDSETIIINGKMGISIIGNDTTKLDPLAFCRFKNSARIFVERYYKDLGFRFSQVDLINDEDHVHILTENDCFGLIYVFDKRTSKLIEVRSPENGLRVILKELVTIDGINFASKTLFIMEDETSEAVHQNHMLNEDIPDSLFEISTKFH